MRRVLSLNEIAYGVFKAARGAGFAWGLAEEAGSAARWLAMRGLFKPAAIYDALRQQLSPPCSPQRLSPPAAASGLCPLRLGTVLCDSAETLNMQSATQVAYPLFAAACLAPAADTKQFTLSWSGATITVAKNSAVTSGACLHAAFADVVAVNACAAINLLSENIQDSVLPTDDGWQNLMMLADKILVPSSSNSTMLGAGGGGLTDND